MDDGHRNGRQTGRARTRGEHALTRARQASRRAAAHPGQHVSGTSLRAGKPRRLVPLLHALFFVAAAMQGAIVPLLPRLSHAYGLSASGVALLLAAPGIATLAISLPVGALVDRLGARRVTVAATALMSAASAAQAAPSYALLISGRLAFGLAFGIVWTSGVVWISSAHREAGSPRIGAVVTSGAVGMVAGPAIGGVLADQLGLSAPFLLASVLAGALAIALRSQPKRTNRSSVDTRNNSLRRLVRVAPQHPGIIAGAAVIAISGAVGGITQLLVPLQLHQAGFSASATGLVFSSAAGVYIVVSALIVRLGRRATTARWAALAGLALSLALLPAVVAAGAGAVVSALLLATGPRAAASTVSYPLATASAADAELADGLVVGFLNGTWAAGLVLAPLLAGTVDQVTGAPTAYLVAIVPCALGALWLLARSNIEETTTAPSEAREAGRTDFPTAEHELVHAT
ncbi:MAG: MFS transporter [Solirubrobacterales bacterium]|nr:MFS transporter [Solirubrobacterales bacterium]